MLTECCRGILHRLRLSQPKDEVVANWLQTWLVLMGDTHHGEGSTSPAAIEVRIEDHTQDHKSGRSNKEQGQIFLTYPSLEALRKMMCSRMEEDSSFDKQLPEPWCGCNSNMKTTVS